MATGQRVTLHAAARDAGAARSERPAAEHRRAPRAGDIRHSLADIARPVGCSATGPVVDFETGLRRTVDWYRASAGRATPATDGRVTAAAGAWSSQLFWNSG